MYMVLQVYQRQMMKSDLADATMQGGGSVNRLSHDELKQLFNLDLGLECSTRKLLESSKAGNSVLWLQTHAGAGSSSEGETQLPAALAAAFAAGAVTAVNREKQQQGGDAEQTAAETAPSTVSGADVEALEVDDDW